MTEHYDIAICGAGLVGITLALALAQKTTLKILLFDAKALNHAIAKKTLDTRTLALNTFSQALLQDLNLWATLQPHAEAIRTIQLSEQGCFAKVFLNAQEVEAAALGYVIEIADLHQVLLQKLAQLANRITVLDRSELVRFSQHDQHVQLELQQSDTNHQLNAAWLIAADSSHSFIRQQLNIPTCQRDYQQTAIVSVLQLQKSAAGQAFERFLKDGVLALLPLTANRCGSVWVTPSHMTEELLALSDQAYRAALQQQFGWQLGPFLEVGPRQHYPLHLSLAKRVIDNRVMIIGNAAHTLNPIGAQGLNLGLHDVACLVKFFNAELDEAQLSSKLLTRNQQLANLSDRAARLYAMDCCPINTARRLSMFALEHASPIKRHFIRRMMGY